MNSIQFNSSYASLIEQFLRIKAASYCEKTIITYRRALKDFDSYLETNGSRSISKDTIDGWIQTLHGADSTVSHTVGTIRRFTEFLVQSGIHAYVPDVPKVRDSYMPHIFTDGEIARIIEMADSYPSRGNNTVPHIRAMLPMIIRISLCCGLRLSEVINLRKRNFNASDGVLVLEVAKDNKQRIVPMHESLSMLLQKYCIVMGVIGQPDAWLFPGKDDSAHISLKTVDNRFQLILREINISRPDKKYERGACFHCLRHTFVQRSFVQLKEMGISVDNSIPYLSIYLGHSNLRQTERYMKFTTDMFIDEFQKFAAFSGDAFPEVCYED